MPESHSGLLAHFIKNLCNFNDAVEKGRKRFLDDKKCNVESPELLHGNPDGIEDVGRKQFPD